MKIHWLKNFFKILDLLFDIYKTNMLRGRGKKLEGAQKQAIKKQ